RLAAVAYNYRWSWSPGGHELFRAIDPARYERVGGNPVRVLTEADADVIARANALADALEADLARPVAGPLSDARPVAFLCAEFGIDASLPIYAGGLG